MSDEIGIDLPPPPTFEEFVDELAKGLTNSPFYAFTVGAARVMRWHLARQTVILEALEKLGAWEDSAEFEARAQAKSKEIDKTVFTQIIKHVASGANKLVVGGKEIVISPDDASDLIHELLHKDEVDRDSILTFGKFFGHDEEGLREKHKELLEEREKQQALLETLKKIRDQTAANDGIRERSRQLQSYVRWCRINGKEPPNIREYDDYLRGRKPIPEPGSEDAAGGLESSDNSEGTGL